VISSVVKIQIYQKGKAARKRFVALRKAAPLLQNVVRAWGVRWQYQQMRRSTLLVQTLLRGHLHTSKYHYMQAASAALQTQVRASQAQSWFRRVRTATLAIQTHIRCVQAFSAHVQLVRAAIVLQSYLRRHGSMFNHHALREASILIQTNLRRALQANKYRDTKSKVVRCQAVVRGHRARVQVGQQLQGQFNEVRCRLLAVWDSLLVPKLHRAMFLVACRVVTISNLFVLLEDEKHMRILGDSAGTSQIPKNQTDLLAEQQYLYQMLNSFQPEGGINQMYIKWNIDSTGRTRKQQICEALFAHPGDLKESLESAELVCRIVGVYHTCMEVGHKVKLTHRGLIGEVERASVQLANVNNGRGCCVLL